MSVSREESALVPPPAPIEYAGKWVAWDRNWAQIVAHGCNFAEVHREAVRKGYNDPIMERVRNPKIAFIGAI
jgi:hypothetical protein